MYVDAPARIELAPIIVMSNAPSHLALERECDIEKILVSQHIIKQSFSWQGKSPCQLKLLEPPIRIELISFDYKTKILAVELRRHMF